jgi:type II secretory pathway pseudopilin PulG
MNTNKTGGRRRLAGITLIECVVYIGVFAVVAGLSISIFLQSWSDSNALRRNAEDIVSALHAGDQWRADVRAATGPIQPATVDGVQELRIPAAGGEVVYSVSKGELRRYAAGETVGWVWLANVKTSQMQPDPRQDVAAWRWELELKPTRKTALFKPLFTFESVNGGEKNR